MKLWKQGLAMALAAAMLLAALTACGPSGPSTPEQPGGTGSGETGGTEQPGKDPGTGEAGGGETGGTGSGETGGGESGKDSEEKPGETGKEDENTQKTEEQKAIEATVKALNTVRVERGNEPLTLNAEASAYATQMARVQLDGQIGVYGSDPMKSDAYKAAWNVVSKKNVENKKLVGVGAYGGYPNAAVFRQWGNADSEWKRALVTSENATLVGVGVVKNTDPKTSKEWPYMVAVMTY